MSDAEMNSIIRRHEADERQKCIDTINSTMHLWPQDMQKLADAAKAKC
jgi:hypothetical protein